MRRWWAIAEYVNAYSNRRSVGGPTITNSHHIAHLSNILCVAEANLLFAGDKRILQLFFLKLLLSLGTCFASLCFDVFEKLRASMERRDYGADRSNDLYLASKSAPLDVCIYVVRSPLQSIKIKHTSTPDIL